MPVFYTLSNEIFYIKTPWKKLYSPRNSMNFFFSLSVLGIWASLRLQPKTGFLLILPSDIKGLV